MDRVLPSQGVLEGTGSATKGFPSSLPWRVPQD